MAELYKYDPKENCIVEGKLEFAIDNVKHLLADVDDKQISFARAENLDKKGFLALFFGKRNMPFLL